MYVYVLLVINCGDPGSPMNGSVTSNGTFLTSIAEYSCDFGFELIGDTQRICQRNEMWTNMVPECNRKYYNKILMLIILLSYARIWFGFVVDLTR